MPSPYRHKNLYLQWQNNEDKKLFKQNNVNSVPTFMVYHNGKPQPIANANGIYIYQYSGTNKQVIANIYHYLQINKPTEKQRRVTNE
jgi:protein-disulfide isomerase-like protein with CxxC motif